MNQQPLPIFDRALTPAERKSLAQKPKKRGHAAPPGTGPEGETCGSCQHIAHRRLGKTYIKCGLMSGVWTGGYGTDIRSRDAACKKWEAKHA